MIARSVLIDCYCHPMKTFESYLPFPLLSYARCDSTCWTATTNHIHRFHSIEINLISDEAKVEAFIQASIMSGRIATLRRIAASANADRQLLIGLDMATELEEALMEKHKVSLNPQQQWK